MTDEDLEALLDELEAGLLADVQAALALTAQDFADALDGATELVAARFSVSGIKGMWQRRVSGLVDRLKSIAGRGATAAADSVDETLPDNWDAGLADYVKATEALLTAVGDRLAAEASSALAEGLNAGEDVDQLKARLAALFADDGTQLGTGRAARIAATEATRAFNAGTLAAAQAMTGPDKPLVKQWLTRNDERVRLAHREANGQLQLLDDPFDVGGTPMQYPGDPTAPAALTVNCRCIMKAATADRTASAEGTLMDGDTEEFQSNMPPKLKLYWLTGEGAAKIRWGTPGAFERCVRNLRDDFPQDPEGLCANLYHEATGHWPGQNKNAADEHTGAMVALMPTVADAERLALDGGETADQLHTTLYYLGEAADWSDQQRGDLISRMSDAARYLAPVYGRVFGAAQWNPTSDEPAWVWNIGDDLDQSGSQLRDAHFEITYALEDGHNDPQLPQQHSPWSPHICAQYSSDNLADALAAKVGPVTFDRVRVAFAGSYTDIPLTGAMVDQGPAAGPMVDEDGALEPAPQLITWSTPGSTALAFENQQTGDGRVFAPGALYWEGGPWPLQYADEMNGGHDGARLAGAIFHMDRDGDRIFGAGVLYLNQQAGVEAGMLLAQGAPLGVSVDLDSVDVEMVDATGNGAETDAQPVYSAHLLTASVTPLEGGGWRLTGETDARYTAAGGSTVAEVSHIDIVTGPDGTVPAAAFELEAAAGDPIPMDGVTVDGQRSGDYLMKITRARVRGATLVSIPAYAEARIVLDDPSMFASAATDDAITASRSGVPPYERVVRHVRKALIPVTAGDAAKFLGIPVSDVRRYLGRAAKKGTVVRIAHGRYVRPTDTAAATVVTADATAVADEFEELVASATGSVNLPVAARDTAWDGPAAEGRVFDWADGDTGKLDQAFAYRDDNADPTTKASRKLGYADVVDGTLTIIPKGVFAAQAVLDGARGGVDIPSDEVGAVKDKLTAVRTHVDEETGNGDGMAASAWSAMKELPPMPAAWFAAPTDAELPPGGAGVNYKDGRVFGWVAQAGEPHAGFAKKVTIDGLGRIDTTHFLRQRFTLDDGSSVKAGAFTMNVGHHRDGAECETSSCQFDDTRTVAGIVTVGMNERGMWFSGAAAPWMSEWDRSVFLSTQPSYHMKKGSNGNWQLRAVLSVPVPGHSSPLLASAVVDRSNLALTAAATMFEVEEAVAAAVAETEAADTLVAPDVAGIDYDRLADSLVAAMARADERKAQEEAELAELLAEGRKIGADTGTSEGS